MNQPKYPKTQQTLVKFVDFWQKWHCWDGAKTVVCPTETDLLSIQICILLFLTWALISDGIESANKSKGEVFTISHLQRKLLQIQVTNLQ